MNNNNNQTNINTITSTASNDSLTIYLRDINRYSLLSKEEVIDLCERIQAGDENAKNTLIQSNLRLVVSIAKKYSNSMPLLDLIQEGNIGLIKSIDSFDYKLGNKFSTYASYWITQSILKAIDAKSRLIKIPTNKLEKMRKINKVKSDYYHDNGIEIDNEEAISKLDNNITLNHIKDVENINKPILSLDCPYSDDESNLYNCIADDSFENISSSINNEELCKSLSKVLEQLPYKEREIVSSRFGLDGHDVMSFVDVGKNLGISKEHARQIYVNTLSKLRNNSELKSLLY